MQSCSIHHCVLFFLTLTSTTAPVSAAVFSTTVKLHQPVTLPCEDDCSEVAKWTLTNNRDVVFAQCDQTSCRSLKEGYEMSHDQYLKGDLSLTITAADYSKRNTYSCECGLIEPSTVRLRIETVFSAVQMKSEEDLILDLSVPEPVEVIYKSRDSDAGEQICTVTQGSLQCKAEYTHRTSLSHSELTLRDVGWSDSGSYTIRDTENNEDLRVYAVSVTGLPTWATVLIVLLLVVGLIAAVIYGMKAEQERRELKRRMEEVDELIKQIQPKDPGPEYQNITHTDPEYTALVKQLETPVKAAENAINDLEQRYSENWKHSKDVGLFCNRKKTEVMLWKTVCTLQLQGCMKFDPKEVSTQLMAQVEEVAVTLHRLRHETYKQKTSISPVVLMYICTHVHSCLQQIDTWCSDETNENKGTLLDVFKQWCEKKRKELEEYGKKLNSAESSVL